MSSKIDEYFSQEYISLDLKRLAKRLVTEDGIASFELADRAIDAYKKFFVLCTLAETAADAFVPSPLVDMVWQRHQLDTANYFRDCEAFSGWFPCRSWPWDFWRVASTS